MCGRYTLTSPQEALDALLPILDEAGLPPGEIVPRFNIAPTQPAPIVANRTTRKVELARWGLVPMWAKDVSIGNRMINARSETLTDKPAFREAFAKRRCLVPADGFFEWKKVGKAKQPYFIHKVARVPLAFAGLWERWKAPDGGWLTSFTIITCPPNALVAELHDRMPVVLPEAAWSTWLAREPMPPETLEPLLVAPPPGDWVAEPVSGFVNKADHEGPACIDTQPIQGTLF